MLNALILPSPKLPTSKTSGPNSPNPLAGTFARPHGELSKPLETRRRTKVPSLRKTLMNPMPGPLKSSASSERSSNEQLSVGRLHTQLELSSHLRLSVSPLWDIQNTSYDLPPI